MLLTPSPIRSAYPRYLPQSAVSRACEQDNQPDDGSRHPRLSALSNQVNDPMIVIAEQERIRIELHDVARAAVDYFAA